MGPSAGSPERLDAHAAFREIGEVAFALPFTFGHGGCVRILTRLATHLGPVLGRRPGGCAPPPAADPWLTNGPGPFP